MAKKKLKPLPLPEEMVEKIAVNPTYLTSQVVEDGKLNARQQLFCREYMRDLNATQAYIRAGYGPKEPDKAAEVLMKNPLVKDMISQLMAERNARLNINADRVIGMLVDAYEGAMVGEDFSPAVRAAQLLGQHVNLFKEHNVQTVKLAGVSNSNEEKDVDADIERLLGIVKHRPANRELPESVED